jgi:ATP-binding cassette subfamily E protein 1
MTKLEGMNLFLRDLSITYRRDESTGRPRVNKYASQLDKSQKESGEYYYIKK